MGADGGRQTRLTMNPRDDKHPAWSPDGTRIAFMSRRGGNWGIYVMNADGSGKTRLPASLDYDGEPTGSP